MGKGAQPLTLRSGTAPGPPPLRARAGREGRLPDSRHAGEVPVPDPPVDEGGRVAIAYGVYGPPETFFIDRDGTIVDKAIGAVPPDQLLDVASRMLARPAAATG